MSEEELMTQLLSDLCNVGLPVCEVDFVFRPYSKTFYGRYYPSYDESKKKPRVALYPYEKNGEYMDYSLIVQNGIHEMCHHVQYTSGFFVRRKGIMHDVQFKKLYNHYMIRAYRLGIIERGECVETV